jgi:hypothetical protein
MLYVLLDKKNKDPKLITVEVKAHSGWILSSLTQLAA